ncbi:ABC-type branched-subunit amino acid transport system ATPase component/ABC-type branched-subunit amino acid transport system permease subunit [Streptacidiphilus sp. BW17]|uniref:ABC transporter permease subunit n=1 Tax=Streptacidiphilus sp. BW17 TaxID=3156274 RepID=UPI003517773D
MPAAQLVHAQLLHAPLLHAQLASLPLDLAQAGLTVGAAAALSGIGLVVCYRATGVLNLAQGAIAMITAYAVRQTVVVWHWPKALAVAVCLLVFAPAIGWTLDALVFRPLQRRDAGPVATLVACLGVFVLLVGAAFLLWGPTPLSDAPSLLPSTPWAVLAVVGVLAVGVAVVGRWTPFGTQVRAVVDNRRLAELAGVDADRVSSVGWAFGAFTAGVTGAVLAPGLRLDPYGLPLLVMETMAVAVIAQLRSLTVAVASALALGVLQSELTQFHPSGWEQSLLQAVGANLFALALLVAVLVLPLDFTGRGRGGGGGEDPERRAYHPVLSGRPIASGGAAGSGRNSAVRLGCAVLLLLPFAFRADDLRSALQVPALALVLLSITVVTGYGGQVSLGQAGYAGLGALFTGLLAGGRVAGLPAFPPVVALLCAVVLAAPLGLLVGWPAIRRRGLALALTTFAVGTAISRLVFQQPAATTGVMLDRTGMLGQDRFFYGVELALLAGALLLVRALRRGRLGRALGAMRDHEAGAAAAGVDVPRLKLLAFVLGAALAALGGGLMGLGGQAFDPNAFDPVLGLIWFAAVVVFGADSAVSAVLAAATLVGLDAGTVAGVSTAVVGALALLLGRLPPGGLAGLTRLPGRGTRARDAAHRTAAELGAEPVRLTPLGRRLAARITLPVQAATPPAPAPTAAPMPAPAPAPTVARREGERLTARNLTKRFQGVTAVDGVTLAVPPGRITALTGPNGAGKSTLFDCLSGAQRADSGQVLLGGRDLTRLPEHARARLGLARTFQQIAVFPGLTVADNLRVGAEQAAGRTARESAADADRLLSLLGLAELRDQAAAELPTGTLRLVELGRALAAQPAVLLLDEPGAGLDRRETALLVELLRSLAEGGLALLLVEHDRELVDELASGVHVMRTGRTEFHARPEHRYGPEHRGGVLPHGA